MSLLPLVAVCLLPPFVAQVDDDEPEPVLTLRHDVAVGRTPCMVAYDAKGDLWVSCQSDTTVLRVDPKDGTVEQKIRLSPLSPLGLAPFKPGRTLAFANFAADTVHWLDLRAEEVTDEVTLAFKPSAMAVDSKGRLAAVACDQEQEIYFVDLASKRVVGEPVLVSSTPHGMAFDRRGAYLSVSCGGHTPTYSRIHVASRQVDFWEGPILERSALVLSPDDKVGYTGALQGGVVVFNPVGDGAMNPESTAYIQKTVAMDEKIRSMILLRRGELLCVIAERAEQLWVYDTETWERLQVVPTGKRPVELAVSKTGRELAVACRSAGTVQVFDIAR